jgi:hypothetical membrane protein
MRRVRWWAVLSAGLAPVFLIGGWTLAARRQPAAYDPVRDTISALAGHGATDRWVMTAGLVGLGACHVVTALGLRPAATPGRVLLATGGVATLLVAAFPVPRAGTSAAHFAAALVAFGALTVWAALAAPRRSPEPAPWALRPVVSMAATAVLAALLGWFAIELSGDGAHVGLSERAVAAAQALWPLCVALTAALTAEGTHSPVATGDSRPAGSGSAPSP